MNEIEYNLWIQVVIHSYKFAISVLTCYMVINHGGWWLLLFLLSFDVKNTDKRGDDDGLQK